MRCPTASGPYRCDRELDANGEHDGECETTATTSPAGPAPNAARASQHIRAVLDRASAAGLDTMGKALGVERESCEPDVIYRERIWAAR